MKRAWNIFSNFFLAILLFLVIAFGGVRFLGLSPYMVASGSMEPDYPVGSLIYVEDITPEDIQEGDVITFYKGNGRTVATHQVYEVDRERKELYTQGINNRDSSGNILHDSEPVRYSSVIGCPVIEIPYLGYVNQFCTTAPGIYILAGITATTILISVMVDRTAKQH